MYLLECFDCIFGEILANRTYMSDFNVCSFTCFDDMLFYWKNAVEDEAEVADNSRDLSFSITESNCVWKL